MNRKVLVLILNLALCLIGTNSMAQETLKGFDDKKDLPHLNKFIRKSVRRLNAIEGSTVDLASSDVKGVLPLVNGGTAAALVDPNADRILFWDDSEGTIDFLTAGTGLTITTTTITATLPTSNVIFSWSGVDNASANARGIFTGAGIIPDPDSTVTENVFLSTDATSAVTLLNFQFTKIAGISTVTIHARIWAISTGGSSEAILTVDIGGQSNTVKSVTSATPTWVTVSTIDVSGLSGVNDGIIQLHNETANQGSYCSAVTLIGS